MTLIRWTLGALFIDAFFVNLHGGNYTRAGYSRLIHHYISTASAPSAWESVERFVANHAGPLSIVQAATEICVGVALAAGLARPLVAAAAATLLLSLSVSELGRGWVWEFPPIIIGSVAVVLATIPAFRQGRSLVERIVGPRVLGPAVGIVAAVAGGLLLALVLHAHGDPTVVVWRAAVVFGLALLGSAILDRRRAVGSAVAG